MTAFGQMFGDYLVQNYLLFNYWTLPSRAREIVDYWFERNYEYHGNGD